MSAARISLRLFLISQLLLGTLALPGCQPSDSETTAVSNKRPKVALIMKSLANEFFSTMAQGAEAHQQEHSDDYELIVNGINDERDLSRQVALVREMITKQVDAIVIAPADSKALAPVLRDAIDRGIVVINIDNKLDDEVLAELDIKIPFVGPDNRAGARSVGEYVASKLSKGDKVVMLEGLPTSFNGQQRRLGFQDAIDAAQLDLVDSQSAQWEMSQANQVTTAMLTEHPDVKAILACNDSMAMGALAAVKASEREGEILIAGFDNIEAVRQAMERGEILVTADQHGDQLAVFGIEQALAEIAGESGPERIETPVDLVTAEPAP